jgi:hypothetical protein
VESARGGEAAVASARRDEAAAARASEVVEVRSGEVAVARVDEAAAARTSEAAEARSGEAAATSSCSLGIFRPLCSLRVWLLRSLQCTLGFGVTL